MENATMVTRGQMYAFIGKVEKGLGRLQMTISRPWTHYKTNDGVTVCAIMDNACLGDPDNTARDHYIMNDFKGYKSLAEIREENRACALEHDNIGFTLIRMFEESIRLLGEKIMTGEEYLDRYFKAFADMENKLNPPKKVKKNVPAKQAKKTPVKSKKKTSALTKKAVPATKRKTARKKSTKK